MSKLEDELHDLQKRIKELEGLSKPKSGWEKFDTFLKMVVVPFTVMGAMLSVYDQVYLSWKDTRKAEAITAQSKLRALEDINTEIYTLSAPGSSSRINAIYEAKAGRRWRLIEEAYEFWRERGDEFNHFEKRMLANELLSIQRIDPALEIIDDLQEEYDSPIDKTQMALLEGRVLSGGEPIKDLNGARDAFNRAFKNSESLRVGQKEDLWYQISYSYLYAEMYQNSKCEDAKLPGQRLLELSQRELPPASHDTLGDLVAQLLDVYRARCVL